MLYYLASPYTSDDIRIQNARYEAAVTASALMLKMNKSVYSPIVHWHVIAEQFIDIPYSRYLENDLEHLLHCDALLVLTISGWEKSFGVTSELAHAASNNKPIFYLSPETGEITNEPRHPSNRYN